MALRRATTDKVAQEGPATRKKSEDRVIKRPARGYHRFKNGIAQGRRENYVSMQPFTFSKFATAH
jgi:hypothetical protein